MKKLRHRLSTLAILFTGAAGIIHVINQSISASALQGSRLTATETKTFCWRFGDICYRKQGAGSPIVLIHDLSPESSGYEWSRVEGALTEGHTVYTLDLLGCGRSDKPEITYTNFLYVQLLCDFVKQVIGEKADVIANGFSSSFTIMACTNEKELFGKIMLVNPPSPLTLAQCPGKRHKALKLLLELPIFGTLIYHMAVSQENLRNTLLEESFFNPFLVKEEMIANCYESAHLKGSHGKYLYASLQAKYLNLNITHGIKSIVQDVMILEGGSCRNGSCANEYLQLNPAIKHAVLPRTRQLPQLETPRAFLEQAGIFFS